MDAFAGVLELERGGVAKTGRGLGLPCPMPIVWLNGVVNEAFRLTVVVDVVEEDRLCTPGNVVPPPWYRTDEYCFVGDGAQAETIGEAWAESGMLLVTISACMPAFMNEAPGPGRELDRVLIDGPA